MKSFTFSKHYDDIDAYEKIWKLVWIILRLQKLL